MIRVFMNIDESWVFEISETFEELLDIGSYGDLTLKSIVNHCVEYCRIYHNFCIDLDNISFNVRMGKLNQELLNYSADLLPTFQYYCSRLYQTVRGAFNNLEKRIHEASVVVDGSGSYYMVVDYE